jgi:hypothetical protein
MAYLVFGPPPRTSSSMAGAPVSVYRGGEPTPFRIQVTADAEMAAETLTRADGFAQFTRSGGSGGKIHVNSATVLWVEGD